MPSCDFGPELFDFLACFVGGGLLACVLVDLVEGVPFEVVLHDLVNFLHQQDNNKALICFILLYPMSKINRSSSEFIKRNHNETQFARIPKEMEDRLFKKTAQLIAKNQSRILQTNAVTPVRTEKPQLLRNKSYSNSKSKLFQKAHQVDKNETFQRPLFFQNSSNLPFNPSNTQYSQYKNNAGSQYRLNEIAERKLLISKVVTQNEDNKSKLTLRGEIFKSQLEKQRNQQKGGQQHSIQEGHAKELTQSKQFFLEKANESEYNRSKALSSNDFYNLSSSNMINEERLKSYSKQLQTNIKQSIKKEMEEHFFAKEKELQARYLQKEKNYLQKFKQLQTVMESQLQKQRSILLSSFSEQLQRQLQKTQVKQQQIELQKQIGKKNKVHFEPALRKESSNANSSQIQSQAQIINYPNQLKPPKDQQKLNLKEKQAQKNSAQINKLGQPTKASEAKRKDSTTSKKADEFKQIYQLDELQQSLPVERVKPNPPVPSQPNKIVARIQQNKSTKPNRQLGGQKGKKSNSIYNDADSYLDEIEEVKLKLESKVSPGKPPANNLKDKYERVNQSFNAEKKLNDSFTSEPAAVKKVGKGDKAVKKQTDQQKKLAQEEQRKNVVRNKLKQQIKNDENVIAIGQVAGYCSKYCKNSKIDWRVPSLLLYRYCFDFFRSFKELYQEGLKLGLIKKEELQRYNNYDEIMEQNMSKMYKSITKKINLSNVYKEIIESQQLQLERLKPYALLEAKNYIRQLSKSKESKPNQGDPLVVQCGVRMINSIYIIRKLNGANNVQLIDVDLQKASQQQLYLLFQKWSSKLLAEQ